MGRAWVVALLVPALLIGVALPYAGPASADLCVLPGTQIACLAPASGSAIPPAEAGTEVLSGSAAGEAAAGCAGTGGLLCGVAAFSGGYQIGCWLASQFTTGSCNPLDLFHFGSSGDDRSIPQLTAASVIQRQASTGPAIDYAGQTTQYKLVMPSAWPNGYSSTIGATTGFLCGNTAQPATSVSAGGSSAWPTGMMVGQTYGPFTLGPDATPFGGVAMCGTAQLGSPLPAGRYLREIKIFISGSLQYDYLADTGFGKTWTTTVTETCSSSAAKSATYSATVTSSTPVDGNGYGTSGALTLPTLPTCDSILPGSNLTNLSGTTGRTGSSTEVTINMPTFNTGATSNYPYCTSYAPQGGCTLDLQKSGHSCLDGVTVCAHWMQDERNYACFWGPYSVALSVCEAQFGSAFDTETVAQSSGTASASGTSTAGAGTTGSASASASPGSAALPTTGTNPTTSTPVGSDPSVSDCLGAAWSWNPVDWVVTPVKCALKWAFVPDSATLTNFATTVRTAYGGTPLSTWGNALSGIGSISPPEGDCGGITIHMPNILGLDTGGDVDAFDTCIAPWHAVALVVKAFLSVGIIWCVIVAVTRNIGAAFGYEIKLRSGGSP